VQVLQVQKSLKKLTGHPPLESGFKGLTTRHPGRGHPAIYWNKAWQAALPQIAAAELLPAELLPPVD